MDSLRAVEFGAGPAVVFMGGCPSPSSDYLPIIQSLKGSFRCLLLDLPGYGESPAGAALQGGRYSMARAQQMIEDELLARGVQSAAFVGFSLGGFRALSLALSGRVRATHVVTLGGMAFLSPEEKQGLVGMAMALRQNLVPVEALVPRFLPEAWATAHPEDAKRVMGWLGAATREVICAELEAMAELADLRPRLKELRVPVLARVGALDVAVPAEHSKTIGAGVLRGTVQLVPGCGHALLYQDLAGTTAAIVQHLSAS